ncbi:MAG: hypothetical protein HY905_04615 [Deltaproteobacteria bacterium]|nr:hypothetical protein [Deltaproteobacteria bacterium]
MMHGRSRVGGRTGAWVAAFALVCCFGCAMKSRPRDMPAAPPEVTAARAEVDDAFRAARDDPRTFAKLVGKAVTKCREALEQWALVAGGDSARGAIRGWAIEVGAIETSIAQLPKSPQEDQLRPIRDSWSRLRPELP